MTDLHEFAEAVRTASSDQVSAFLAYAPRRALDEARPIPDPKPSPLVENIGVAVLVALPLAVLSFGPLLS